MPGNHVATPDGRHVWEYAPRGETDLAALVKAAAAQVLPDAKLTAFEQRAVPGEDARLVTTLTRHPGGATVQVHARIDESFTLVYDAIVTRAGQASTLPTAVGAGAAVAQLASAVEAPVAEAEAAQEESDAEILADHLTQGASLGAGFAKWSPDTGETVGQRLATIVGGAMGYEPEDLPWEVPLIELGLDSLMAVRIKNRVEYDFDLPPIQLQAVRDANLYAVEKLIQYAIEHRDEVEQLHEHQQTQTPEEIAAAQAALARRHDAGNRGRAGIAGRAGRPGVGAGDPAAAHRPVRPCGTVDRAAAAAAGAEPAGGRRRAGLRRAAARRRRAGHVRDVGDRHRQVAGRHLQRAARARRRDRGQDGAAALRARRGHHHRRGRDVRADHRGAGHHRARVPRGR